MPQRISVTKNFTNNTFDTYVPQLTDNANIQEAFELFYYGDSTSGNTYDATNSLYTNIVGFNNRITSTEALVAGVTGGVVGATNTQTLTNKTLTSPKINDSVAVTASSTELNVLDGIPGTLTATELGYVDGVTSAIQTQLNDKSPVSTTGLVLVKTQTIGTAVTSVTVTDAFSTTYDNYKILISGGVASITANMTFKLGATVTGYYWSQVNNTFANTVANGAGSNATSFGAVTRSTTAAVTANIELDSPFLTNETMIRYSNIDVATSGSMSYGAGYLNNTTSYTDFTIAPTSGTYTGGTIYVYGYKK